VEADTSSEPHHGAPVPGANVAPDRLLAFAAAIYEAAGMRPDEARLAADTLVQADLWGHQSHGVMRLSWYAARLKSGVVAPLASPETVINAGAIAVIDGHDAMGQVVAAGAAKEAVKRAKAHGVGVVAVRNSNHFGTAMYFTRMAALEGCVGFLAANASPAMAPWGGRENAVGTNPWSWAAPAGRFAPLMLDIANTGVARGKIYLARQKGVPIPEGWAVDGEGVPTTDPVAALAGASLPMAGHKGYAIAVVMDMLAGVLGGGSFGRSVAGPYQSERRGGVGHFLLALDIEAFQPRASFEERLETLITELKGVALAKGVEEIVYPGELESRNAEHNLRIGIELPDDTLADLARLAEEYGCPQLLPFGRQRAEPGTASGQNG
jgi:LDH2 family malate/lactate/ureidoglycolate dehydrogenase